MPDHRRMPKGMVKAISSGRTRGKARVREPRQDRDVDRGKGRDRTLKLDRDADRGKAKARVLKLDRDADRARKAAVAAVSRTGTATNQITNPDR